MVYVWCYMFSKKQLQRLHTSDAMRLLLYLVLNILVNLKYLKVNMVWLLCFEFSSVGVRHTNSWGGVRFLHSDIWTGSPCDRDSWSFYIGRTRRRRGSRWNSGGCRGENLGSSFYWLWWLPSVSIGDERGGVPASQGPRREWGRLLLCTRTKARSVHRPCLEGYFS